MTMTPQELRNRLSVFAKAVVTAATPLLEHPVAGSMARQLIRSSTGAAANHRAAGYSRTDDEFCSRISVALEEADETVHWLDQIQNVKGFAPDSAFKTVFQEALEVAAILGKSRKTAYANKARREAEKRAERAHRYQARPTWRRSRKHDAGRDVPENTGEPRDSSDDR